MSPVEPQTPMIRGRASGVDLRRSILETTKRLLVDEGYESVSMRKIARAVGCSATSIYLHFSSKDALIHTLIDAGMEELHAVLDEARDEGDSPLTRLEALCRAYVGFGLDNPEYYEVMFTIHPERMARYPVDKYRRARRSLDLFAAELREAEKAGEAEVGDADVAACVIWAALHGAVSLLIARRLDVRVDPEEFVGSVVDRTVAGYRLGDQGAEIS